ncbi:MAG: OmpA family protein [Pedobacter sp.]|nr:OmpA family protein [Pedobacter sp.]
MLVIHKIMKKIIICCVLALLMQTNVNAQQTTQPTWWFGVSGGANANFFDGTTQRLNNSLIVPAAFHKGKGIRPFGSVLLEYRPSAVWGGSLNLGYDGRGGKFDGVIAPCNCPATLKTNNSYITIEPSLRLSPGAGNFYLFAGPRIGINLQKGFNYTQLQQPNTDADFSEMRKTVLSGQVGIGYDIVASAPSNTSKFIISPFVSYHPYFGQDVRNIESWSLQTVRAGIAFKFGTGKAIAAVKEPVSVPVKALDVSFTVLAPKPILYKQMVSETLPLLSYVFFDEGSTAIPTRYNLLSKNQASAFKEVQLQNASMENNNLRSSRQMETYYHVLNIIGDRMRSNSNIMITLSGASLNGPTEGKAFASVIKDYLTNTFDIAESRIATNGRTKPIIPSEQPGGKKELTLLRAGDRRVDIQSTSEALMMEVGGGMMKPIQINAVNYNENDRKVVFNVVNATEALSSYTIDLTDQAGVVQHYGPFTKNQESIMGDQILGTSVSNDYKVVMLGTSKLGTTIRKESTLRLESQQEQLENSQRYSILFNFNKENTNATYNRFLTDVVAPLIADGSTVMIHGHTDVIGEEQYNLELSNKRAQDGLQILKSALSKVGKNNVKFETSGFGEALDHAPFENNLPEERFYNRTVIIDIMPQKK